MNADADTSIVVDAAPVQTPAGEEAPVELSIVIPCLNEARTLGACIEKAQRFLREYALAGEVVVADNGSTDGSQEIARGLQVRVVHVRVKGYGSALMQGIAAARGTFIVMGDADDSYDFSQLGPFLERLRAGDDLVVGNRFAGGIRRGAMPFLNRYLGNPALTGVGRLFFGSRLGDFHCGLRAFSKAAAKRMDLQTTGMEFASEMVVKATLLKLRISEVPTSLSPAGRDRPPHLRPWRDGWRHLRFMLIYSPRWLFLYPGLLLIWLGVLVGGWLLPGPRTLGHVTYDVQTLLYAAMSVLVGVQAVSFAVFTRIFAASEGLLPEEPRLKQFLRAQVLDAGLLIGVALMIIGFAGSVDALWIWSQHAFGPLDQANTLRLIIVATTLLVLGCQLALSSFFLGVLSLRRRGASGTAA